MRKSKLWLGLSGVMVFIFALLLSLTILANTYAGYINDVLGLTTSGLTLKGSSYGDKDGNLTNEGYERLIKDSYQLCIDLEEQGSVLLKNDGALPLKNEKKVTLFGASSASMRYRSGAGGPTPNDDYVVNLADAFTGAGFEINQTLYNKYATYVTNDTRVSESRVCEVPATFYTDTLKATFDNYKDAAIVTFSRYGTENTDPTLGIMALDPREEALLKMINDSKKFKKIVVLLCGPLPMELGWLDKYNVNACLWFGNPGYYGLPGVANVVAGKANPSGHAVFTFAANSMGAPAMANFGDYTFTFDGTAVDRTYGTKYVVYKEGIYVGYKYYETRYEDCVLGQGNASDAAGAIEGKTSWNYADEVCFPFGYGLSYSTYTQTLDSVTYDAKNDKFVANVTVKNTNNTAGKFAVQVYVQLPYTAYDKQAGVEKAAIQLCNYGKVDVPAGGTVKTKVEFDRYTIASYDEHEGKGGYILEPGTYYFALGNGAHEALNNVIGVKKSDAKLVDHTGAAYTANTGAVKTYEVAGTDVDRASYKKSPYDSEVTVENKFADADLNYWADADQKITYLTRKDWKGTFPTTVRRLHANSKIVDGLRMDQYKKAADAPSYKNGKGTVYSVDLEEPIDFIDMKGVDIDDPKWDEFVSQLSLQELTISMGDARGINGVAAINKPGNSIAEGPEGILAKFKYGDKRAATGFPTLPIVTATFDHAMQSKYGDLFAEEALFCGVAMINAPGTNIIRTPYSSRASEYMSEDSMLSYYSVSNILYATRQKGLVCNVKHCFLNNQETNRQGVATFSNEQAIREIYLRPFEGALTRGKSLGIMTSYNRIGLQYAATHSVLMYGVLRGEWAYRGSIIDDALSQSQYYCSTPDMLMAGTNIFCLDAARAGQIKTLVESTDDGTLLKKLQESNKYIFYALINSSMGGSVDEGYTYTDTLMWWQSTLIAVDVILGALAVGAIVMYVLGAYIKKKED